MSFLADLQKENPSMKQDLKILHEFVIRYRPEIILEVGTGHSTLAMAYAANLLERFEKIVTIYSTDIDIERTKLFNKKINDNNLYHVILLNEDSLKFLSNYEGMVDLIFIDSAHTYDLTLKELEEASGKLSPNGYILMHDVISVSDVQLAIKEFLSKHPDEFKYFILKTQCGIGVLQRK